MSKPRLLDLFCAGGGAGMGYHRAGFEVVGVDINPQPNYPFEFHQADALTFPLDGFDAIHASPPCQLYTRKNATWGRARTHWIEHPDLVGQTRDRLEAWGAPYVIENVMGAPLRADLVLCGTMFGLTIRKHRQFESNVSLPLPPRPCSDHSECYDPWSGAGRSAAKLRAAMGIDWLPISGGASRKAGYTGDLFNAIPPAYTEWIGRSLAMACPPEAMDGPAASTLAPSVRKPRPRTGVASNACSVPASVESPLPHARREEPHTSMTASTHPFAPACPPEAMDGREEDRP